MIKSIPPHHKVVVILISPTTPNMASAGADHPSSVFMKMMVIIKTLMQTRRRRSFTEKLNDKEDKKWLPFSHLYALYFLLSILGSVWFVWGQPEFLKSYLTYSYLISYTWTGILLSIIYLFRILLQVLKRRIKAHQSAHISFWKRNWKFIYFQNSRWKKNHISACMYSNFPDSNSLNLCFQFVFCLISSYGILNGFRERDPYLITCMKQQIT